MGFLNRRKKLLQRANRQAFSAKGNPIAKALRLIAFLAFYVVWSSCTSPETSGWRADLRRTIEKHLGWKLQSPNQQTPNPNPNPTLQKHRIPCGLILIDKDSGPASATSEYEEDVLPLTTFAVVPTENNSYAARSTLNIRALEKYPQLKRHVVTLEDEVENNQGFTRWIPGGTFRLRMDESTIEESPPLWILEDERETETADLVLGTSICFRTLHMF